MKDKRALLFDSALKLFVERGFHNTPTSLIAKEAGVATGTLFHYFKTKEELINTLYLNIKDEMILSLSHELQLHETVKAKMKQLFLNSVNWAVTNPFQHLFFMQFSHSTFIDQITRKQGMQRFNGIFEIIEEGKKTEVLKNIPTEMMFELLQGFFNGAIKHFMENKETINDKKTLEDAFSVFWDAIKG